MAKVDWRQAVVLQIDETMSETPFPSDRNDERVKRSTKEYRDRAKQYHDAIHRILLHEWDPIGIADEPETQDEYDNYIPQIHGMLLRREPKQKLFDHLWTLETERIGLLGSRLRTEKVVDLLIALREQIEAET